MPDANALLHSNLHEVFSERDPERRWSAIERTYTEDVTFVDPEGEFVGRKALSDQAQKLVDGGLAGFVLEEDGPRYIGTDTAALAWRLGPPGAPVARGIDILTIRDGERHTVDHHSLQHRFAAPGRTDQGRRLNAQSAAVQRLPCKAREDALPELSRSPACSGRGH